MCESYMNVARKATAANTGTTHAPPAAGFSVLPRRLKKRSASTTANTARHRIPRWKTHAAPRLPCPFLEPGRRSLNGAGPESEHLVGGL